MKLITLVLAVCLLIAGSAGPSSAIVDIGDPRVTRLWKSTDDGDKFTCSATWIREARPGVSWLLTAGHCKDARFVKREVTGGISAIIYWRAVISSHNYSGKVIDIALATAPDNRDKQLYHSFLAEKFPTAEGTDVYIHGFPNGIEAVVEAQVIGPSESYPGSMEVQTRHGALLPGSSGSVVLDEQGFIVGVMWGGFYDYDEDTRNKSYNGKILITPVEHLHTLIKLIEAKL